MLLLDCLALWGIDGSVAVGDVGVTIVTSQGDFLLQQAPVDMRPVRWLMQTPDRRAAGRPPRALPSIVALLAALRHGVGAEGGNRIRIGASA